MPQFDDAATLLSETADEQNSANEDRRQNRFQGSTPVQPCERYFILQMLFHPTIILNISILLFRCAVREIQPTARLGQAARRHGRPNTEMAVPNLPTG